MSSDQNQTTAKSFAEWLGELNKIARVENMTDAAEEDEP